MATVDKEVVVRVMMKLLDKAGNDPRLTSRILREKVEEKLKLKKGDLKSKREFMKLHTLKWWYDNHGGASASSKSNGGSSGTSVPKKAVVKNEPTDRPKSVEAPPRNEALVMLTKLARAVGKGPNFFKPMMDMSDEKRISRMRRVLREEGLTFSDTPSAAEIAKCRDGYEMKKDAQALDQSNVLNSGTKRPRDSSGSSAVGDVKKEKTDEPIKKKPAAYNSSDEEADF